MVKFIQHRLPSSPAAMNISVGSVMLHGSKTWLANNDNKTIQSLAYGLIKLLTAKNI